MPRRDGESLLQCSVQATSHAPLQLYRLDTRDTPLLLAGAGAGHAAPDTRHVSPAGTRYTCTQHSAQGVRYFTEQGTQTLANGYSTRWGKQQFVENIYSKSELKYLQGVSVQVPAESDLSEPEHGGGECAAGQVHVAAARGRGWGRGGAQAGQQRDHCVSV